MEKKGIVIHKFFFKSNLICKNKFLFISNGYHFKKLKNFLK